MVEIGSYLVGRKQGDWPSAATPAEDMLFAAARIDGQTLEGLEFAHCTFANVSFKNVALRQCRFTNCAFLNCYFRKTQMAGGAFVGCKFIGCEFPHATIQSCDFKYSRFDDCSLPFDEMEHSLPREPNLREELTHCLAIASDGLGLNSDGRKYRLVSIQAREEHLKAAFLGNSDWYQRHYTGLRKLKSLGQFLASKMNGFVWGYGEKWHVLVGNLLILATVGFPALLWLLQGGLDQPDKHFGVKDLIWPKLSDFDPNLWLTASPRCSIRTLMVSRTFSVLNLSTNCITSIGSGQFMGLIDAIHQRFAQPFNFLYFLCDGWCHPATS